MTQPSTESKPRRDHQSSSPDEIRNPRAGDKGADMPEDHGSGHRTDPVSDYERPDGNGPRKGMGGG